MNPVIFQGGYRHCHPGWQCRRLAGLPNGTAVDAAVDGSLGHPIGADKLPADWVLALGPNARSNPTPRTVRRLRRRKKTKTPATAWQGDACLSPGQDPLKAQTAHWLVGRRGIGN
jgi:hypothetical protein